MENLSFSKISIRDILNLDQLNTLQVIAGEKGLDRVVTNVNVMEVPDISGWVTQGQLLLTTAFSIKDDEKALAELIPMLNAKGAAGLMVKLKRYLAEFPQSMIKSANELNFPLIEMPMDLSHPIVIDTVLCALNQNQMHELRVFVATQEKMIDRIAKGGKLKDICQLLYDVYGQDILVLDRKHKLLEYVGKSSPSNIEKVVESIGQEIRGLKSTTFKEINGSFGKKYVCIVPIHNDNNYQNFLIALNDKPDYSYLTSFNLERATSLIALIASHDKAIEKAEKRYQNEFMNELLNGKIRSYKDLLEQSKVLGWDLSNPIALLLIRINEVSTQNNGSKLNSLSDVFSMIRNALYEAGTNNYLGSYSEGIAVLLPISNEYSINNVNDFIEKAALNISNYLNEQGTVSFDISSGKFRREAMQLPQCYKEAVFAMQIGKQFDRDKQIHLFDNQSVFRLIYNISEEERLHAYKEYYIPLFEYDKKHGSQLVETVKMYFELKGNVSQVSKALFTHYNTVLYRLNRILSLTGIDIKLPRESLVMYLSILIGESKKNDDPT